jgi:hypothetical protein
MTAEDPVWIVSNLLLDCLQAQFTTGDPDLATPVNFCWRSGEEISEDIDPWTGADLCCEGLGWVRVGNTFPSSNFPNPDEVSVKCLPTGWAQVFEVGLLGCYVPGGQEHMPTCAQHTTASVQDMARLRILKQALCCFDATDWITKRGRLWTIQSIEVSGPRSNCISRVATILVNIPKCC